MSGGQIAVYFVVAAIVIEAVTGLALGFSVLAWLGRTFLAWTRHEVSPRGRSAPSATDHNARLHPPGRSVDQVAAVVGHPARRTSRRP
jgi:hypothetical protein